MPYLELLNKESARGKVLISTGFLEEQLKQILQAFFIDSPKSKSLVEGAYAPLGTFSSRITTCYALGLISEKEFHELNLIRGIRNDFAHNIHTSFETQSVVSRCEQLKYRAKDYTKEDSTEITVAADGQFTTAAVGLIMHLVNRPHYVSKERCEYKNWKY